MFHLARILTPVTSSASVTGPALAQALHLAARAEAELHFVRVETPDGSAAPFSADDLRERVLAAARRMDLPVPVEALTLHVARVSAPSGAEGALAYADEATMDLIVADHAGEDAPALTDPRTDPLVQQARCPVFTVADGLRSTPQRILAPVDFSAHAQTALAHAKTLADYFDATLHALHVIENPHYVALNSTDMLALADATLPERKAQRRLESFVHDTAGPDVPVRFHVMHGDAAEHISTFASAHEIDLLVLASHGMLARRAHPLGNVARKTLRRLTQSTFLVKAFGTSLMPARTTRDATSRSLPDASTPES